MKSLLALSLLLHGTKDDPVPCHQALDMRAKLRSVGVPCDLITVPDGPHGMIYWDKFLPSCKDQVVAWLERTLPAPAH
jgi:dipeptidyl aminopeptidase/acylaminoacyl peptidase